jgi:sugar phosphate isomerase/epimerase
MTRPAISISTTFNYDIPIDEQIAHIAQAGFSHVSLGANADHSGYLSASGRKRLKALVQQNGLSIDTVHGPRMDLPDSVPQLTALIEAADDLGAPVVVVHAGPFAFDEAELPTRLKAVLQTGRTVEPVARNRGIKVALENVLPGPATQLVKTALDTLDPTCFGFCYDSAHDQIGGPKPLDLLASMGNKVFAVHFSDRVADFVDHLPPGEGWIDWERMAATLRSTVFTGPLLFEVMITHASQQETRAFLELVYHQACRMYHLFKYLA